MFVYAGFAILYFSWIFSILFLFLHRWWFHINIFTIRSYFLNFIAPNVKDFNFTSDFPQVTLLYLKPHRLHSQSHCLVHLLEVHITTTWADTRSSSWIWFAASKKNDVEFDFIKTFNSHHNYLSYTTLKQYKFKKVTCLIMAKDSVHIFQKVSWKRNSTFMCVYKIATYVNFYIWLSYCLRLYSYKFKPIFCNKNLKNSSKISWYYIMSTYQVEFTIRILNRGVLCINVYNTWKQA